MEEQPKTSHGVSNTRRKQDKARKNEEGLQAEARSNSKKSGVKANVSKPIRNKLNPKNISPQRNNLKRKVLTKLKPLENTTTQPDEGKRVWQLKLLQIQKKILPTFENLKLTITERGKVAIKEGHFQEAPKTHRLESLNAFKENLRKTVETSLMETLELAKISKNHPADSLNRKIYNVTKQNQIQMLEELLDFVNTSIVDVKKMEKETEENKQSVKLPSAKKRLKRPMEASKPDERLTKMKRNLKTVEKQQEKPNGSLQPETEGTKPKQKKNAKLREKIKERKKNSHALTKKISQPETQPELQHTNTEKQQNFGAELEGANSKLEKDNNDSPPSQKDEEQNFEEEHRRLELKQLHLYQQGFYLEELRMKLIETQELCQDLGDRAELLKEQYGSRKKCQKEISKLLHARAGKKLEVEELASKVAEAAAKFHFLEENLSELRAQLKNTARKNKKKRHVKIDLEEMQNLLAALIDLFRRGQEIEALQQDTKGRGTLRVQQKRQIRKLAEEINRLKQSKEKKN